MGAPLAPFAASPPLQPWTWQGAGLAAGTLSHALAGTLVGSCPAGAGTAEGLVELAQREERMERSRKRESRWKHTFARSQLNLPGPCCFLSWPHLLWGICYPYLLHKGNYPHFLPLLGSNVLLLLSPPPASPQLLLGDGPALERVSVSRHW